MWHRVVVSVVLALLVFSACSERDDSASDKLNAVSYGYHYRDLDSAERYALAALEVSGGMGGHGRGVAAALNNLAFVRTMRMDYAGAERLLDSVSMVTDDQVELLIAHIQQMRLCQRRSRNRDFYDFRAQALRCLDRIREEHPEGLSGGDIDAGRLVYAESELAIVLSTYYYYVGLERQSIAALEEVGDLEGDTAQWLNYLYNVGAGGIITTGSQEEINAKELWYLEQCLALAREGGYPYFEANALEALSEHGVNSIANAEEALRLFMDYGDVYQTAGAYRTLGTCYHGEGDDSTALYYLSLALEDEKIEQAPDLVASIYEQLSVAYSGVDDKESSDAHRNIYLELQHETRQDLYLQSRAAQYEETARQQKLLMSGVVASIVILVLLLLLFYYLHKRHRRKDSLSVLLEPLREWQREEEHRCTEFAEEMEELSDERGALRVERERNERLSMENRAKLSLVNMTLPLIDRILHEVHGGWSRERIDYIRELTEQINAQNDLLTHWIQLRQGALSLRIESFALQELFDVVSKSKMSFQLKGIRLDVEPTDLTVKADRILTLFMLNTLADNARKFTGEGGSVKISASRTPTYAEISVSDTGKGMSKETLSHLFEHKVVVDDEVGRKRGENGERSHGFGLMNCRGIIEKYRKMSHIFSVCTLEAESEEGKGSRLFFRLPLGRVMSVVLSLLLAVGAQGESRGPSGYSDRELLDKAYIYSDSAYFSNINGTYARTLAFADSCRKYLNAHYLRERPGGRELMLREGDLSLPVPELAWYYDSVRTNYDVILDIRNESAVAALALHEWSLYAYNNKVYTQLFKERSADSSLDEYCRMMQQSETNRTIGIVILILILGMILPAYYLLYYRHRLNYRFCVERIGKINEILLSERSASEKLEQILPLASSEYPEELQVVVSEIVASLRSSVLQQEQQFTDLELAKDELRRAEHENNNLHVSNSVLDNCLSTLKHETMYYPSRIRQLIDSDEHNMQAIEEVVTYYRELYALLSEQAMRQLGSIRLHLSHVVLYGHDVLGDETLLHYLFEILTRHEDDISGVVKDEKYVLYSVAQPQLHLTSTELQNLFTPSEDHIPYLLCRQIVRDHSEATARRGCGIWAEEENGKTIIKITLPRWNHSK